MSHSTNLQFILHEMGKTKRIRQKFHAPAKIKDGGDKEMASSSNMDFAVPAPSSNIPIS